MPGSTQLEFTSIGDFILATKEYIISKEIETWIIYLISVRSLSCSYWLHPDPISVPKPKVKDIYFLLSLGGGIPPWVIAKRNIRIRHSIFSFFRLYDEEYQRHCIEWMQNVCEILRKHQITVKDKGCVIGFQIENENFELFKGIPMGLADDMRYLAKTARDCGISVPLFTNDGWEEGSWVARPDDYKIFGKPTFGIDLYGF